MSNRALTVLESYNFVSFFFSSLSIFVFFLFVFTPLVVCMSIIIIIIIIIIINECACSVVCERKKIVGICLKRLRSRVML